MNARQARAKAKDINSTRIKNQMEEVYKWIDVAAEGGKYDIYLSQSLLGAVITKLKSDGFTLTSNNERNETNWVISW